MRLGLIATVLALATLQAPAEAITITTPVAAGSVPSKSAITPLQVNASAFTGAIADAQAVVIGPQSVMLTFTNSYANVTPLIFGLSIANARFASAGAVTLYGSDATGALVALTSSGCTATAGITTLLVTNCTVTGGPVTAMAIAGITYNYGSNLATAGQVIPMSAGVQDANYAVLETTSGPGVTAVTSVGSGGSNPGAGTGAGATPSYLLLTATAGAGAGTISPASLGTSYPSGTVVTLTAAAASGSAFIGWSGACTGAAATCQVTMSANEIVTATFMPQIRIGAVASGAQTGFQSFLRFYNAGATAGTVAVTLSDSTSGTVLARWTSPSIPPGAAPQYAIASLEAAITAAKPAYYSVQLSPQFAGSFQYALWDISQAILTNQSICNASTETVTNRLTNVHSSTLGAAGYAATVVVYNTGAAAAPAVLSITSAADGSRLGSYTTAAIAANGQVFIPVSQIEAAAGIPQATIALTPHYVIQTSADFTGYLQNLVTNTRTGVVTDMTTVCALAAQ